MPKFTKCWYNKCDSDNRDDPDILFYKFPKDTERCRQWVHNCSNADLTLVWNMTPDKVGSLRVCQKHFLKEFLGSSCRLVGHAVPAPYGVSLDQIDAEKFMVDCASLKSTSSRQNNPTSRSLQQSYQQETVPDTIQYTEEASILDYNSFDHPPLVTNSESYTSITVEQPSSQQQQQHATVGLQMTVDQLPNYQQLVPVTNEEAIQSTYMTTQLIDNQDISQLEIQDNSCLVPSAPTIIQQQHVDNHPYPQQPQSEPEQLQQIDQLYQHPDPHNNHLYQQPQNNLQYLPHQDQQQQEHNNFYQQIQPRPQQQPELNLHHFPQPQQDQHLQPQQEGAQYQHSSTATTIVTNEFESLVSHLKSVLNANPKIVYDKDGNLASVHYETATISMIKADDKEKGEIHVLALKHKVRHYQRQLAVLNHRYQKLRTQTKGRPRKKTRLLEAMKLCKSDVSPIFFEIFKRHLKRPTSKNGNRWSNDMKNFSSTIYLRSKSAYRLLRKTIDLPSESIVKRHVKVNKISNPSSVSGDACDEDDGSSGDEAEEDENGSEDGEEDEMEEEMDEDEDDDDDDEITESENDASVNNIVCNGQ